MTFNQKGNFKSLELLSLVYMMPLEENFDILPHLKDLRNGIEDRAAVRPLTGRVRKIQKSGGPQKNNLFNINISQITRLQKMN